MIRAIAAACALAVLCSSVPATAGSGTHALATADTSSSTVRLGDGVVLSLDRAAGTACGAGGRDNGTGYVPPPRDRSSLPFGSKPGPELLYRRLASTPQLRNTGPWRAAPLMVSGIRGYRDGEFVYQDFLYDDRGVDSPADLGAPKYPADPVYAANAADLVEVRLRLLRGGVGVRLSYNSMVDPQVVAASIALGSSSTAQPLPHGAGASSRGEVFVTVHGCRGDAVRASDGSSLGAVKVTSDLRRRQVDVRVPYSVYDPRKVASFEVRAAAGLWDLATGSYLRQDEDAPAFLNVAFRETGEFKGDSWMTESQTAALTAGDISPLVARVEVSKLRSGRRDDLVGKPGGLPRSGPINRIYVSHFEPQQGRGASTGGNSAGPCEPPECTYTYSGRLQQYTAVIPDKPAPRTGYPLAVTLHGSGENQNANENDTLRVLANAGRPTMVVAPGGRGPGYWWYGLGAADVYEAWADAAANYHLDPRFVIQTGQSMGGYGTYKLASTFPDLYQAAVASVGPGVPTLDALPGSNLITPPDRDVRQVFASLRHVPVLSVNSVTDAIVPFTGTSENMQVLEDLGYRHDFWFFVGTVHSDHRYLVQDQYAGIFDQQGPIDRNPRHVTYVVNATVTDREFGVVADHAYWVSKIRRADQSQSFGTVDVVSGGIPTVDPPTGQQQTSQGVATGNALPDAAAPLPYIRYTREWGQGTTVERTDTLTITTTNVSSLTIDVDRARLSCHPRIDVTSEVPLKVRLIGRGCGKHGRVVTPSAREKR